MNNISYVGQTDINELIVKVRKTLEFLKILSEENRLEILLSLLRDTRNVSEISTLNKLSQSLVSHHLHDLKVAGLVSSKRSGKWIFYSITDRGILILKLIYSL